MSVYALQPFTSEHIEELRVVALGFALSKHSDMDVQDIVDDVLSPARSTPPPSSG